MATVRLSLWILTSACWGMASAAEPAGGPTGSGTAFVVGRRGYLITCAHVVRGAGKVVVTIGGKAYEALVLQQDEQRDLALLQIDAGNLTPMPLVNSDVVEVGQDARAFGFPLATMLGDDIKVTRGTIAGVSAREGEKVFQIDAAVNPGNSGGPLVNERGEVLGVVNAKIRNELAANVAFAVPINYVKPLLAESKVVFVRPSSAVRLDGPALVKRVSPSVAFVTVWTKGADVGEAAPDVPAAPKLPRARGDGRVFDLGGGVRLELVLIRPGSFIMGSRSGEKEEMPARRVTIARPFCIGKYEVTQEQWQAVMGSNPSHFKELKGPVEQVGWDACQTFITKLNARTGRTFSLPTEAQWEYACRAGTTTRYSFGDGEAALGDHAWFHDNYRSSTHVVGGKKPNPWGIFDMHGNVWEWCQDTWHDSYNGAPTDGSAWLTGGERGIHVVRGGSCYFLSPGCRSASRRPGPTPGTGWDSLGFRVLLGDF